MQTSWLMLGLKGCRSDCSSSAPSAGLHNSVTSLASSDADILNESISGIIAKAKYISAAKATRLIEWNVDVLHRLLHPIGAVRKARGAVSGEARIERSRVNENKFISSGSTVIDEVKEIISLPRFNPEIAQEQADPDDVVLPKAVYSELHHYVANIALMYKDHAFHNFEVKGRHTM
jgi:hypothetical protein